MKTDGMKMTFLVEIFMQHEGAKLLSEVIWHDWTLYHMKKKIVFCSQVKWVITIHFNSIIRRPRYCVTRASVEYKLFWKLNIVVPNGAQIRRSMAQYDIYDIHMSLFLNDMTSCLLMINLSLFLIYFLEKILPS